MINHVFILVNSVSCGLLFCDLFIFKVVFMNELTGESLIVDSGLEMCLP